MSRALHFVAQPRLAWAAAALAAGLLIARLPLTAGAGLLAGAGLTGLSLLEPASGLALAMLLGPAKSFLAVARPGIPSDLGQIFFALAAAGWLARGLARREIILPRLPLLVPLGVYTFAGLLSLLGAASLEEGLKELLKWAEVIIVIIILEAEVRRGRLSWILGGVLLAGAAQAAIGLWQYEFQDLARGPAHFRILGTHFRAYGSFEQPNPYGGFLGLIWPVAAGLAWSELIQAVRLAGLLRKGRSRSDLSGLGDLTGLTKSARRHGVRALLLAAVSLACLAGLYVSFSRGAWLGAAAAAVAMAAFLPRRLGLGLGLVALGLAAGWALLAAGLLPLSLTSRLADVTDFVRVVDVRGANINDANFAILERLAHWQAAQDMARARPWLGVGLGNYAAAYPEFSLLNWPNALGHAHMIYLNVLAETGVVGLMTYVILWVWIIGLTIRIIQQVQGLSRGLALGLLGAWAHLSVHQVVDNLYVNNIHFLIAALLALLVHLAATRSKSSL